jgi:hypothetical protein
VSFITDALHARCKIPMAILEGPLARLTRVSDGRVILHTRASSTGQLRRSCSSATLYPRRCSLWFWAASSRRGSRVSGSGRGVTFSLSHRSPFPALALLRSIAIQPGGCDSEADTDDTRRGTTPRPILWRRLYQLPQAGRYRAPILHRHGMTSHPLRHPSTPPSTLGLERV